MPANNVKDWRTRHRLYKAWKDAKSRGYLSEQWHDWETFRRWADNRQGDVLARLDPTKPLGPHNATLGDRQLVNICKSEVQANSTVPAIANAVTVEAPCARPRDSHAARPRWATETPRPIAASEVASPPVGATTARAAR